MRSDSVDTKEQKVRRTTTKCSEQRLFVKQNSRQFNMTIHSKPVGWVLPNKKILRYAQNDEEYIIILKRVRNDINLFHGLITRKINIIKKSGNPDFFEFQISDFTISV